MNRQLHATLFALLSAPLVLAARPVGAVGHSGRSTTPAESSALRAASDPALETLRAGRTRNEPVLDQDERAALKASQDANPDLADLRGGVGVVEVLLIVVLVLVILILV